MQGDVAVMFEIVAVGAIARHVRVAHALRGDLGAQRRPVHLAAARDFDRHAALLLEQIERVLREQAAVPFRALVARVGAALGREVGAGFVGVVRDRLHRLVVELDRLAATRRRGRAGRARAQAHHAEADRAVAAGWTSSRHGVG